MKPAGPDAPTLPAVVLSAVLCGGSSRRMGRDKALLELGGRSLLARAASVLAALGPKVLLACGSADRYAALGLERVLDRVTDGGPLGGLEAVLSRAAEDGPEQGYVCVLACDMPGVRAGVFEHLLARAEARAADVCLLTTDKGAEPLLAVYRLSCLQPVRRALDAGERRMTSFHTGFGDLAVETLAVNELPEHLAASCARNVNTPADYQAEADSDGA